MLQPLWYFLSNRIWALTAGIGLAGAALLFLGPSALWGILALSLAAAIITRFVGPQSGVPPLPERPGEDSEAAIVPHMVRQVLAQLPAPVMLLDSAERVLFVNEPMRALLGPGVERRHVSIVLRNPDILAIITKSAREGVPADAQFTLPVPIERNYHAFTARIRSEPAVTALVLHDLTAIRRSERMRADFVANASHELRTPLAAVSGFIDTLRGHAKDDVVAREQFLEIMSVEAARMRRLIDDLLSLTRIEQNEHVPPQGRVALEGAVREAATALAPLARAENISVEIAGADLPEVVGERDELIQLFQNLIHNAIKYGGQNGHVWITLGRTEDGQIFASVRDDGVGIPQGAIPRLTERFYRVDVKRSREKGGTGLGLAIVKHIVSRHQGRLAIESPPGEGAIFTVFLPAPAENAAKPAAVAPVTEML